MRKLLKQKIGFSWKTGWERFPTPRKISEISGDFVFPQIVENTVKSVEKNKYTSSSENGSGFLPIIVKTEFTSATKVTIVRIMVSFETFFI